jgi:hypothetical protein
MRNLSSRLGKSVRSLTAVALFLSAPMLAPSVAQAAHWNQGLNLVYSTRLTGANEVPAVATAGQGVATLQWSNNRDTIYVRITVAGLSSAVTGAAINQGNAGSNGALNLDLSSMQMSGGRWQGTITGAALANLLHQRLDRQQSNG